MTAPSIKEALELKPCPFCGGNGKMIHPMNMWTKEGYGPDGSRIACEQIDCPYMGKACYGPNQDDDAIAEWNTRAALSPPAGERREAIARITTDPGDGTVRPDVGHVLARGFHAMGWSNPQGASEDMIEAIASGLVQDEAGWRDISTAPKNHFPVLTWSEQGGSCVAFLDATWTWWPCPATEPLSNKPTHWMPLPAQPIRSARDGGAET